jgi:putative sterol carrier protein
VLSELLAEGSPGWEENRAAVVELLREVLPYGPAVFYPPNFDREYTECYGFSLEDIFAFGLKLIRQRWRTIGYPTEEMPPGVFPFDPEATAEEVAQNQVKLMEAGILGPPEANPEATPETQRLYFDVVKRAANTKAANGSPLVYQWRFDDADPWHLVIDNGSTRAEPGEAPNPTLTLEAKWADFVGMSKPEANPMKMLLTRRIRPRGSIREIARMRKVFG